MYRPEYCEKALEYGAQGKSRAWMAAEFGVSRITLMNWEEQYPEFLSAMTRARELAQRWWEDVGQDGLLMGSGFNGSVWSRSMSARFPDDWREKTATEHSGTLTINHEDALAQLK